MLGFGRRRRGTREGYIEIGRIPANLKAGLSANVNASVNMDMWPRRTRSLSRPSTPRSQHKSIHNSLHAVRKTNPSHSWHREGDKCVLHWQMLWGYSLKKFMSQIEAVDEKIEIIFVQKLAFSEGCDRQSFVPFSVGNVLSSRGSHLVGLCVQRR